MDEKNLAIETFVCFSCLKPNEYGTQFCKFCNAPISQTSSSDPLQIAFGEGMAYRKAVEGKPKFIIVLGVWLIFLPTFIVSSLGAIDTISYGSGTYGLVFFWVMLLVAGFSSVMIYRVTKNYVSMDGFKHKELEEDLKTF